MNLVTGLFLRYRSYKYRRNRARTLNSVGYGVKDNQYFLVSYPKSGNTWVRFLLANLLKSMGEEISLLNVGQYVPDAHVPDQLAQLANPNSDFNRQPYQILKTHDPYFSFYRNKNVIYIVRDGRDAINSYYYYLKARTEHPVSLADVIRRNQDVAVGGWSDHVTGWTDCKCKRQIVLQYENMIADPLSELSRLLEFLDWHPDRQLVESTIQASSFGQLQQIEATHGTLFKTREETGKTAFFRKGEVGDWKNNFTQTDLEDFWKRHKKGMQAAGYL